MYYAFVQEYPNSLTLVVRITMKDLYKRLREFGVPPKEMHILIQKIEERGLEIVIPQ